MCPFHALTCATGFSMSGGLNASALLGTASIPHYVSALAVLMIVISNSIASPSAGRVVVRLGEVQGRSDGRAGGRPGTCGRSTTPSCTLSSAATRKRQRFKRPGGRSHGRGGGRGKIAGGGGWNCACSAGLPHTAQIGSPIICAATWKWFKRSGGGGVRRGPKALILGFFSTS